MKVEISDTQLWLITRGLLWLSSDEGEVALRDEFPNLNIEAVAEDLESLLNQVHAAKGEKK